MTAYDHHPDFSPDLPAWVTHSLPPVPGDQVMMSLVWAALQALSGDPGVTQWTRVRVAGACPGPQLHPHQAKVQSHELLGSNLRQK